MNRVADELSLLAPALAFLLAAVPLAHLLGELGFFEALAGRVAHHARGVWPWWVLAALTTAVLNLDTTIVLLTPLYIHIARRRGENPIFLAAVPLVLANLASSVLPVSNLTTLVASEQLSLTTGDLVRGLGPASVAMVVVGLAAHRAWARGHHAPIAVPPATGAAPPDARADGPRATGPRTKPMVVEAVPSARAEDRRALVVGTPVVGALLVAFVLGPVVGLPAWVAVVVADGVLMVAVRRFPWRSVPLLTSAGVAALGALVAVLVAPDAFAGMVDRSGAGGAALGVLTGTVLADVANNLPALLALLPPIHDQHQLMPVLLGVNAGAVLTPIGSLANLLWLRTARRHGLTVRWVDALTIGVMVGGPALLAGAAVLVVGRFS